MQFDKSIDQHKLGRFCVDFRTQGNLSVIECFDVNAHIHVAVFFPQQIGERDVPFTCFRVHFCRDATLCSFQDTELKIVYLDYLTQEIKLPEWPPAIDNNVCPEAPRIDFLGDPFSKSLYG